MRASLNRAAVNKGWGKIHPEYLMAGPYGTVRTRNPSRGGKSLRKPRKKTCGYGYTDAPLNGYGYTDAPLNGYGYTDAPLNGYGYTDAPLNGYGYTDAPLNGYGYTDAPLNGYGGYNDAPLKGASMESAADMGSALLSNLSESSKNVIGALASKLDTTITDLANNPGQLVAMLSRAAPKVASVVKRVVNTLKQKKAKTGTGKTANVQQYVKWARQNRPDMYKNMLKQMQEKAWDEYKRRHQVNSVDEERLE